MEEKDKPKSKVLRIFGLLFVIVIFIYLAIIIPIWPIYRPKSFCSRTEADANNIAAAIADYFFVVEHTDIARGDMEKLVFIDNPWTFTRCGDNFYIHVIDRSGKCPAEIQNKDPNWNSNIFTLKF